MFSQSSFISRAALISGEWWLSNKIKIKKLSLKKFPEPFVCHAFIVSVSSFTLHCKAVKLPCAEAREETDCNLCSASVKKSQSSCGCFWVKVKEALANPFYVLAFFSSERKYAEVSVLSVMFSWRELLLGKSGSFSVLTQYNFSHRNPGIFFEKQKAELNPWPCWLAEVSCGYLSKIYSFYRC